MSKDDLLPRPKQPNSKMHWTALALARYFEKHGEAARIRDLYPLVTEIHDTATKLSSTLYNLYERDVVDYEVVISPGGEKKSRTFAYYPTNLTIDVLRDLGQPTKLPNGDPVPEELQIEMPTDRISSEDDVPLPTDLSKPAVTVSDNTTRSRRSSPRDIDRDTTPAIRLSPEPRDLDDDLKPAITATIPDNHVCKYCGDTFDTSMGRAGHEGQCGEETQECPDCGETFKRLATHIAVTDCDPDATSETDAGVAHDQAYMDARTVEKDWDWLELSNRFQDIADKARENGIDEAAATYDNFAALAMERDLDQSTDYETVSERKLPKGLALMMLGAHHSSIKVDPDEMWQAPEHTVEPTI